MAAAELCVLIQTTAFSTVYQLSCRLGFCVQRREWWFKGASKETYMVTLGLKQRELEESSKFF